MGDTVFDVEVDLTGSGFTFLCGDKDHTVCCTRTVEGRRAGVLEDFHRLDVVGVDVAE